MEIRVLEYFLAVARFNSFSKAAEVLHVTQPTLSRQIKELEDTYNKQFFVRHSRCVCLTEDGILFKRRAEEIVTLVNKTEEELMLDHTKLAGDIFLGAVESDGFELIAKTIRQIKRSHPDIKFHLLTGNNQELKAKLDAGIIDLALVIDPVDMKAYDFLHLPYYDSWGVWMKEGQSLEKYDQISAADLKNVSVYISDCEMVKNQFAGWIGGNQRKLNVTGTYDLIHNVTDFIEDDTYVLGLQFKNQNHLIFKPLSPELKVGLNLIWPKYAINSKIVDFFLSQLQETMNHPHRDD